MTSVEQYLERIRDRNACVYEPEEHDCAEGIDPGCDWCVNRRDAEAALAILNFKPLPEDEASGVDA